MESMVETLAVAAGLDPVNDFFLPHRDTPELDGDSSRHEVFDADMASVDSAAVVVAMLDGQDVDSGTSVELGYAFAKSKKLFGLITDMRAQPLPGSDLHRPNLMVWGVCEAGLSLFSDLTSLAHEFAQFVRRYNGNKP